MKKFAFLVVLLAFSTVALGVPKIEVKAIPPCPDTHDSVTLLICGCAPGDYGTPRVELNVSCGEQYLMLDVYMEKKTGLGIDRPFQTSYDLGKMCPGMYMVAVALHLDDYNCYGSDVAALNSTFFTVEKRGCGCGWPMWWPF
jgi:hypothetical protein